MDSSIKEIKAILNNFRILRMQVFTGLISEELKDKLEFLENCVKALDEDNRFIMETIYFNEKAVTSVAKCLYITRQAVYKRKDKLLKQIETVFRQRFK